MDTPNYEERITRKKLNSSQPEIQPLEPQTVQTDKKTEALLKTPTNIGWIFTLIVLLATFIAFSLTQSFLSLMSMYAESPITAVFLGSLIAIAVVVLLTLVFQEWTSYFKLKRFTAPDYTLEELVEKDDKQTSLAQFKKREKLQSNSQFAAALYQGFNQSLKPHHTNKEVIEIFENMVLKPINQQAKSLLAKDSLTAGGIAFISPNTLLQSLGLLWMSFRTLNRIAKVYGLRPSLSASLLLFQIAMENLAANTLTDMFTDEIASQIGANFGEKIVGNATEAVVSGSLNQRLGRSLIKVLEYKSA